MRFVDTANSFWVRMGRLTPCNVRALSAFRRLTDFAASSRRGPQLIQQLAVPARAVGGFFEMSMDTARAAFRRPFQFREFLDQTWMVARVSLVPTLLVSIPFTVLVAFTLNILLREIGPPTCPAPERRSAPSPSWARS